MYTNTVEKLLHDFEDDIRQSEVQEKTLQKYRCDMERFFRFMGENDILEKEKIIEYKKMLLMCYKPTTAISYLMTVNRFLKWMGRTDCCVKLPRVQKRYSMDQAMSEADYRRLLAYAKSHGKWKYYCIMRTLAGTGMRVGELHLVTCESFEKKTVTISNKNKIREIYFTDELSGVLHEYANRCGIKEGPIFVGRENSRPLDCSSVWKTLKRMAARCGVNPDCVYPHSFRHLFARTYMKKVGNVTELADILGHSNLETTRIYTMGTREEKRITMAALGL